MVYAERKVAGFIQDRLGPMEVGHYGLAQTIADLVKLIQKEDITPKSADHWPFKIAPLVIFISIFLGFSILPININWVGAGAQSGIFFLITIISLDVLGVLMAGWSSNSKFSLFGAIRSVAQIISYEVPMGLVVLSVAILCQSLDLQSISIQQGIALSANGGSLSDTNYLFGIKALGINVSEIGGFLTWNIFRSPILLIAYLIFFVCSLAESNRVPFDLPEAESELIGGFHTEYSGFRWSIIMLAEYAMVLLLSFLGVILFLGSWHTPLPNIGSVELARWTSGTAGDWSSILWGSFWLIGKTFLIVFVNIWVRFTYPRLRVDQLMNLSWKYLTPAALIIVLITSLWRILMIN